MTIQINVTKVTFPRFPKLNLFDLLLPLFYVPEITIKAFSHGTVKTKVHETQKTKLFSEQRKVFSEHLHCKVPSTVSPKSFSTKIPI